MLSLSYAETIALDVRNALTDVASRVNGFFTKEHNADGGHGAIVPTSVTLQGAGVGTIENLAFDAARYTVNGGTSWTVALADQLYLRFSRLGQMVFLQFYIQTSVVVGNPDFLVINLPELHAIATVQSLGNPAYQTGGVGEWVDVTGGTSGIASVSALAGNFSGIPTTAIYIQRYGHSSGAAEFAQWPATTELWVSGSITFMVNPDNAQSEFFGA